MLSFPEQEARSAFDGAKAAAQSCGRREVPFWQLGGAVLLVSIRVRAPFVARPLPCLLVLSTRFVLGVNKSATPLCELTLLNQRQRHDICCFPGALGLSPRLALQGSLRCPETMRARAQAAREMRIVEQLRDLAGDADLKLEVFLLRRGQHLCCAFPRRSEPPFRAPFGIVRHRSASFDRSPLSGQTAQGSA